MAEIVLPAMLLCFMATVFGRGEMERLSVGVVDYDFSATSRRVISLLSAVPTLDVAHSYANEQQARSAVSRGEIYGFVVVPPRFEADVEQNRPTQLRYYYHYALMSVGGQLYAAFENALRLVAAAPVVATGEALGVNERMLHSFVMPVVGVDVVLVNPTLNYTTYLAPPFYHVMLQVLVLLITVYAVGSEVRDGTARQWLERNRGDIVRAVAYKLLPHGVMFGVMACVGDVVMYELVGVPRECPLWQIMTASVCLVAATMAVGVVIVALLPRLWMAMSVASMFGSLGATLCGVTFPLSAMYGVFAGAARIFPMMHFARLMGLQTYAGMGLSAAWGHYVALLLMVAVSLGTLPLLRRRVERI